jgi:hypothetical protein
MLLQLIYLHSATGGLICVFCICIISSHNPSPIYLHAVSIYFCFASMKSLGFQILGKMNVGFSFKNVILFALISRVGRYIRVSVMEWKQKILRTFRITSDFYMVRLRMSELWWTPLKCEAGNGVIRYETIQQTTVCCYELQYKIVKKLCVW